MSKHKKILIVDDSLTTLFLVQKILEKEGFNIIQAKTGKECIDLAEEHRPDLVLLDIMLPDISGDTIFFKLREKHPRIKVILFSSLALSDKIINDLKMSGLISFLRKPLKEEDLIKAIKDVI